MLINVRRTTQKEGKIRRIFPGYNDISSCLILEERLSVAIRIIILELIRFLVNESYFLKPVYMSSILLDNRNFVRRTFERLRWVLRYSFLNKTVVCEAYFIGRYFSKSKKLCDALRIYRYKVIEAP
jgi:hypothetical protein